MTRTRNLCRSMMLLGAIAATSGCSSSSASDGSTGGSGAGSGIAGEAGANSGLSGASGSGQNGGSPGNEHTAGQGGSDDAGEGGGSGAVEPGVLDPPPNLDLRTCEDFGAMPDACIQCCTSADFSSSTIYDGKCICGTHVEDSRVCGASTAEECFSCCNQESFASSSFDLGEPAGGCLCENKTDEQVCASALDAPDPESACQICCLNNGFLSADYEEAGKCSCQSG